MKKRIAKVLLIVILAPPACYWSGYLFSHTVISPCSYIGAGYYMAVSFVGAFAILGAIAIIFLLSLASKDLIDYIKNG